jgi:molybdenum cofactor cytidylyltransferase
MATTPSSFSVGVFILAAGRSTRMGQPKLLLPWCGTSILGHLIRTWKLLQADSIAVVVAQGDHAIAEELDRLGVPTSNRIVNPCPDQGMFSSIQCAARWKGFPKQLSHCAIVLGDQPHIQLATLKRMVQFAAEASYNACQPAYCGRARHPVFLPAAWFRSLAESSAATLKQALANWEIHLCECDDAGLDFDLDTPADYQRALAIVFQDKS